MEIPNDLPVIDLSPPKEEPRAWWKKAMCWLTGGHTYKSGDFQQLHIPEMCVTCFIHQCIKCGEYQVYAVKDEVLYGKYPVLEEQRRWIPVTERLPDTVPCSAGTAYSEAVNVLTSGRKVLTAIWDGMEFIADAEFWEAYGETITHWTPVLLPLPEPPKEDKGNGFVGGVEI